MGFWALDVQELQVAGFFFVITAEKRASDVGKKFLTTYNKSLLAI